MKLFYIQNTGFCGNCLRWWKVDGNGYTSNLDEAWKVSEGRARTIEKYRPGQDIAWPVELVDKAAHRHVVQGAIGK